MYRIIIVTAVALAALAAAVLSGGAAPASAKPKTLKFASITKSEKRVGKFSFVSTSVDKAGGKVIGYDVLTGNFNPKTEDVHLDAAIALEGGILYGEFDIAGDDEAFQGKVTGGTGDYKNAEGTFDVVNATSKKSLITVSFD